MSPIPAHEKTLALNPHVEAAERIRQLAQILANDPAEARQFLLKTGVYTQRGTLRPSYR